MEQSQLRRIWAKYFSYDWQLGVLLIVIFVSIRFVIALNNAVEGGGNAIFILFLSMWVVPFILLNSKGRRDIGIKKPDKWIKILYCFLAGAAFCGVSYLITYLLFGYSVNNSFVYMSRVYGFTPEMLGEYKYRILAISMFSSMTFSPIGEELLFRGVIHGSFVKRFGENKASLIDSLAFMVAHLPHFGIIYNLGKWSFPVFPAMVWMLFMFLVSRLFFRCRVYSDSIWGAVVAHSGYNCLMMYITFFHIL